MMRHASDNWTWATPTAVDMERYAVMRWKNGALYAGPVETAFAFPPHLIDSASMLFCTRAEALRHAVESKVQA